MTQEQRTQLILIMGFLKGIAHKLTPEQKEGLKDVCIKPLEKITGYSTTASLDGK